MRPSEKSIGSGPTSTRAASCAPRRLAAYAAHASRSSRRMRFSAEGEIESAMDHLSQAPVDSRDGGLREALAPHLGAAGELRVEEGR